MDYDINPLHSNILFNIGQPLLIILAVFTAVAGLLTLIGHLAHLTTLDAIASKWLSRFTATTLYTFLIWLALSMIISYVGNSVLDLVNGIIILTGVVVSLAKRASSDQIGANRALVFTFAFLAVILIWHFIYGAINVPKDVTESVGDIFRPQFWNDLFRLWHWF